MNKINTATVALSIAIAIVITIGGQQVYAEKGQFKVNTILTGVDSETGELEVAVTAADGTLISKYVDPFGDGYAGNVKGPSFVFESGTTKEGEQFEVCVYALDANDAYRCESGENTEKNSPETVRIEVPSGIGRAEKSSYRNTDQSYAESYGQSTIIPAAVDTQTDSPTVAKGQKSIASSDDYTSDSDAGVDVRINGDNNKVTVGQKTSFGDLVKSIIPEVKETAKKIINTATTTN